VTDDPIEPETSATTVSDAASGKQRRKIPGGLPYTTTPGALEKTLEKLPIAERPSVFSPDFLSTVIGVSGGSGRAVPPILKSCGFLTSSATPTELYDQFRMESSRGTAALTGLKKGYAEIFKRNQFAHRLDEKALSQLIATITELRQGDSIARLILNTFKVFQKYALGANEENHNSGPEPIREQRAVETAAEQAPHRKIEAREIGLVYNINVVLPETTNIDVYNAIFRSLRENMLQ
jgi:hypothetical protein